MFVTLKKDYLGHRAGAMLDILEEPVVKSLVEQGIAEATQGDPYGPLMAKAMEATIASLTKNIETVFNEAIRQFGHAQSKSRRNAVPAIFGEGNDGDPKKTFGHFLLAVRNRDVKTLEEMGSRFCEWDGSEKKAAMNTQTGAQGGYLVPTEFYNRLMMLATERSIVRQRATIVPMSARSVRIPVLDMTTAPDAGDSAKTTGAADPPVAGSHKRTSTRSVVSLAAECSTWNTVRRRPSENTAMTECYSGVDTDGPRDRREAIFSKA